MTTADALRAFVKQLVREEQYDSSEGCWCFRSGGSCLVCTDSAIKVAHQFGGKVFGYDCTQNASAVIGKQFCAGHDFAIVENRFLVDYWAYRVTSLIADPVFDLLNSENLRAVQCLYGHPYNWEEVVF